MIIISSIVLVVLIIIGIFTYLYLTTDMFRSNQTLFAKYLTQAGTFFDHTSQQKPTEINDILAQNKYTSSTKIKAEYVQDMNTSAESKENAINEAEINIDGKIDKANEYEYHNIRLSHNTEELAGAEILQSKQTVGLRLKGIKQFVSSKEENLESVAEKLETTPEQLQEITNIFKPNDLSQLFAFSEEEKQVIQQTYWGIMAQNTNKDAYAKQTNYSISINGKPTDTDVYSVKLTKEKYNDLVIKLLEKLSTDDLLLGKLDKIEDQVKRFNQTENAQSLREQIVEMIKQKIKTIQDTNIGQEETKISVFENNHKTVRISIETNTEKITIDLYNNQTAIKIDFNDTESSTMKENTIIFEKNTQSNAQNMVFGYRKNENGKETQSIELKIDQKMEQSKINNTYQFTYAVPENKISITANQYINIVNQFEDQIEFSEENNIDLNTLEKEPISNIFKILTENVKEQTQMVQTKIKMDDINTMLKKLGLIKEDIIQTEEPSEVTEAERNRFNSSFTFFIGQELTAENINQLLEVAKESLSDAEIIIEGDREDRKELTEIKLYIKRNTQNEEKRQEVMDTILSDKNKNKKYDITMKYDEDTKLINFIDIKVHKN